MQDLAAAAPEPALPSIDFDHGAWPSVDHDSAALQSPRITSQHVLTLPLEPLNLTDAAKGAPSALTWSSTTGRGKPKPSTVHNWPGDILYTRVLVQNLELHKVLLAAAQQPAIPNVRIQKLPADHPAAGSPPVASATTSTRNKITSNFGLFATSGLSTGTLIGEYTGLLRQRTEQPATNHVVNFTHTLEIDAQDCGNECRFINDFWGD